MEKRHCFGMLYKYELLKILKNKVALVTFIVAFCFAFIQGEFEVSGNITPKDLEKYQEIDDRAVDQSLLNELKEISDDAGNIQDENRKGYEQLSAWMEETIGYRAPIKELDIDTVYSKREKNIQEGYDAMRLTQGEIGFWANKEKEVDKPFLFHETIRSGGILEGTTNYMLLMAIIIGASLSMIFASETQRKTDPMLRVAINGNKELYFAKILAGMSYIFVCIIVLLITFYAYAACRWGITGMDCMVQSYRPLARIDMTIGELLVIILMLLFCGILLISSFALFLSNVTRNGVATMTIVIGSFIGLLVATLHVPLKLRVLSQILYMLPGTMVSSSILYDYRLIRIGKYFMSYQIAPIVYILFSIAFIVAGYVFYDKYEIKSN
ncbi:ABC transporter permease [Butyrivibrio sp. AE2005]|uniref:ABC transporter permease n=1 Tax=Butyrivibrio sp. AE2005 TaxID=1496722 RepID=UPI00047D3FC0|nr:ABC transporter permease subunit [Butyrivibrio sp. AE2005]